MLVILDTSVLISLLVARGESYARETLKLALQQKIILIASEATFEELRKTLKSIKIKKQMHYKSTKIGSFIAWYKYNARFIEVTKQITDNNNLRDASDVIFLSLAKSAKADYLLTIDKDLLVLKKYEKTVILTPEQFMRNIVNKNP
jgi:putative PIN family toxin of toxin-antitoxin system